MNDTKPWYQSTTIIGAATSGIISLAGIFQLPLGDLSAEIQTVLYGLGALIGLAVTILGRIRAEKTIG